MPRTARIVLLLLAALGGIAFAFHFPPIPQDPAYHDFADSRAFLGIANFGNVMSNIPFIAMGIWGMFECTGLRRGQYAVWMTFFFGVFLTGFGSGYYHLMPNNGTLVWDRLPMTIGFMSLLAALIMERIDGKNGLRLFPALLAAGFFSVWYWHYTDDLRPYALAQFLPILEIILILLLFPATHGRTKYLLVTAACYVAAKLLEHYDPLVFSAFGYAISGHTLKHLAAATGIWGAVKYAQPSFPAGSGDTVVLLHGALNHPSSMRSLQRELVDKGYNVINVGYPSHKGRIEVLIDDVHEQIKGRLTGEVHFIGHSMGGLMIRAYIHKYRPKNLGRVVMLGTPNQGSEVADWLANNILYKLSYGPAGQQLRTNQENFSHIFGTVDYPLGIIAGDRWLDPVAGLFIIPGANDGRVSVVRTKLEGMKDHTVVHAVHVLMPHNPRAIRQALRFLEQESFEV